MENHKRLLIIKAIFAALIIVSAGSGLFAASEDSRNSETSAVKLRNPVANNMSMSSMQHLKECLGYNYLNFYNTCYSRKPETILISAKKNRSSFLGDPGKKMKHFKRLLLEAAKKIRSIRGELDKVIDELVVNERKIKKSSNAGEKRRLIRRNIALLKKMEHLRLRIARIQLQTARKILKVEQDSYKKVSTDVTKRLRQINGSAASYWLWRRQHLLQHELKGTLSSEEIKKLYNN